MSARISEFIDIASINWVDPLLPLSGGLYFDDPVYHTGGFFRETGASNCKFGLCRLDEDLPVLLLISFGEGFKASNLQLQAKLPGGSGQFFFRDGSFESQVEADKLTNSIFDAMLDFQDLDGEGATAFSVTEFDGAPLFTIGLGGTSGCDVYYVNNGLVLDFMELNDIDDEDWADLLVEF